MRTIRKLYRKGRGKPGQNKKKRIGRNTRLQEREGKESKGMRVRKRFG